MSIHKTPLERHDADRAELHRAIGAAITAWADLEYELGMLFSVSLGDLGLARAILNPILAFSARLQVIDAAVSHKLAGNTVGMEHWLSLKEYIRELSGDRNYIAHTPLLNHGLLQSEWVDGLGVRPMLDPGSNELPTHERRILPMSVSDVHELFLDFQQCRGLVGAFWSALSRANFNEEFHAPIARRRAARGIRQEKDRKLYQARSRRSARQARYPE